MNKKTSNTKWLLYAFMACTLLISFTGCGGPPPPEEEVNLAWPPPPEQPRIKYLSSLTGSKDFKVEGRNKFLSLLIGADGGQTMLKPYGVAADKTRVYVTDTGMHSLWVFDRASRKVNLFGFKGEGQLRLPTGVCPGDSTQVFVADSDQARVFLYDSTGTMIRAFGHTDELSRPVGVAFDSENNRLYVADSQKHLIVVFDSDTGKFLKEIGKRGEADGEFNFPTNIFYRDGRLYITDTGNFRVQTLTTDGEFLFAFGEVGDRMGDFVRPKGIGVDSEGNIYVVDAGFDNYQIFNEEGELLLNIGAAGHAPGQFWLPAGLWVDKEDKIYVVDSYNQRVQMFQYFPTPVTDTTTVANDTEIEIEKPQ